MTLPRLNRVQKVPTAGKPQAHNLVQLHVSLAPFVRQDRLDPRQHAKVSLQSEVGCLRAFPACPAHMLPQRARFSADNVLPASSAKQMGSSPLKNARWARTETSRVASHARSAQKGPGREPQRFLPKIFVSPVPPAWYAPWTVCRACLLRLPARKAMSARLEPPLAVNFRSYVLRVTIVTLAQHRPHNSRRHANQALDARLGPDILSESATGVQKVIFALPEALLANHRVIIVQWAPLPKPLLRLCTIATRTPKKSIRFVKFLRTSTIRSTNVCLPTSAPRQHLTLPLFPLANAMAFWKPTTSLRTCCRTS